MLCQVQVNLDMKGRPTLIPNWLPHTDNASFSARLKCKRGGLTGGTLVKKFGGSGSYSRLADTTSCHTLPFPVYQLVPLSPLNRDTQELVTDHLATPDDVMT